MSMKPLELSASMGNPPPTAPVMYHPSLPLPLRVPRAGRARRCAVVTGRRGGGVGAAAGCRGAGGAAVAAAAGACGLASVAEEPAGGIAIPGAGIAESAAALGGGVVGADRVAVGGDGFAVAVVSGMAGGWAGTRAVGIVRRGATVGRAGARLDGMRDAPNLGRTSSG